MKLENQVCSLELAKKLKELGVKQESLFYYRLDGKIGQGFNSDVVDGKIVWNISAFTVAELYQIIYDKGLSFGLPNRLKPEVIPTYMASFLIMALEKEQRC